MKLRTETTFFYFLSLPFFFDNVCFVSFDDFARWRFPNTDINHENRCKGDRCSEAIHDNRDHGQGEVADVQTLVARLREIRIEVTLRVHIVRAV